MKYIICIIHIIGLLSCFMVSICKIFKFYRFLWNVLMRGTLGGVNKVGKISAPN